MCLPAVVSKPESQLLHVWNARMHQIFKSTIHKRKIVGADCAVSSLDSGGLHCEPLGGTNTRIATACEKGGQENKHMSHKG